MKDSSQTIKVAAAQAASVFLNRDESVKKACHLIEEAAENGAKLVVFPESFISGYPDWVWLVPNSRGQELNNLYVELVKSAITVGDESTRQLCDAAKKFNIHVAIGINEINNQASGSSLYNSLMYIGNKGNILGVHRKLVPTGGERLIWAPGDGEGLVSFDTEIGKIGGLICWENFMPMARQAMYVAGTQIYVAPTWDNTDNWLQSLRHIAREGGMYVIGCCMAIRVEDIPEHCEFRNLYPEGREWVNVGNSCIINPKGEFIAGPVDKKEEILFAEINLDDIIAAKRSFDVAGHYYRPDVFNYSVNKNE